MLSTIYTVADTRERIRVCATCSSSISLKQIDSGNQERRSLGVGYGEFNLQCLKSSLVMSVPYISLCMIATVSLVLLVNIGRGWSTRRPNANKKAKKKTNQRTSSRSMAIVVILELCCVVGYMK
jgi:hypothetical protein